MLFSCQRMELPEDSPILNQGEGVRGEVKITFSAQIPMPVQTKAMGEEPFMTDAAGSLVKGDLQTMHLVVFDENGMLVETQEAKIIIPVDGTHNTGRYDKEEPVILPEAQFEVNLTVSDQPRIIHFIANCPVNQITYGHESSIIGNMYVTKANSDEDPKTTYETAYWGRVEFPYILVEKKTDANGNVVTDEDGNIAYIPHNSIISKFQCIPMVRNFAQIVVRNNAENFNLEAFAIYNTIDKGTVAPYNSNSQKFQSFTFGVTNNQKYSYPQLTYPHLGFLTEPYEGHALASAQLNTDLHGFYASKWVSEVVRDENGDIIRDEDGNPMTEQIQECAPYYLYERKVSARTDQEELWNESPPHLIIKGSYNNGASSYYKADLIYSREQNGMTSNHYYNILRNFRYQFTVVRVSGDGYPTPEEAIQGAPSNNLSISTTTTKFTNISDEYGRLFVSYTDTTLVSNNQVSLKYKYVPDLDKMTVTNNDLVADGGAITLENLTGDVISDYEIADSDIVGGQWDGYREITFFINDPEDMTKEQTVVVRTDNANLTRDVRYYLKNKYLLEVECTPKVEARIGAPVEIDLKLPVGLTDDMFPLTLSIEVDKMSLSPDATQNTLPVEVGASIIPGNTSAKTFHFVKTFETREEYDNLPTVGTQKILTTYWITNVVNNEATVWVTNKYFNDAYDNFVNAKAFVSLTLNNGNTVREGAGRTVSATLVLPESDNSYTSRNIKFTLEGLSRDGSTEPFYITPTSRTVTINNLVTTDANSTLKITAEEDSYAEISASVGRRKNSFSNLAYNPTSLDGTANKYVAFSFDIPEDGFSEGMAINVTLDGFASNDPNLLSSETKAVTSYVYYPNNFGTHSIKLKTESTAVTGTKTCKVTLNATSFEEASKSIDQIGAIVYKGNVSNLTGTFTANSNVDSIVSTTITSISSTNNTVTYNTSTSNATSTFDKKKITSTVKINNLVVSGQNVSNETQVEITVQVVYKEKNSNTNKTGTITINKKIRDLGLTKQ